MTIRNGAETRSRAAAPSSAALYYSGRGWELPQRVHQRANFVLALVTRYSLLVTRQRTLSATHLPAPRQHRAGGALTQCSQGGTNTTGPKGPPAAPSAPRTLAARGPRPQKREHAFSHSSRALSTVYSMEVVQTYMGRDSSFSCSNHDPGRDARQYDAASFNSNHTNDVMSHAWSVYSRLLKCCISYHCLDFDKS